MSTLRLLGKLVKQVATNRPKLRMVLSISEKGYLDEIGWFKAFQTQSPIGKDGEPIPWVTYSFIDFITERLNKNLSVFEFGSGNSTFFYAKHAGKVVSVEHDKEWYDKIVSSQPENAKMIFCELVRGEDYCHKPLQLGEKFDIIIVDGRDRVNCCLQSVNALSPGGVVVLDDSEREFYNEGMDFLKSQGFKQLSFSGISPGLFYNKATSIFYKPDNCLNI